MTLAEAEVAADVPLPVVATVNVVVEGTVAIVKVVLISLAVMPPVATKFSKTTVSPTLRPCATVVVTVMFALDEAVVTVAVKNVPIGLSLKNVQPPKGFR